MRIIYAILFVLFVLYACAPIRPIYISPSPSPFFHKESGIIGAAIMPITEPSNALWLSVEYMRWKNRVAGTDFGIIPHFIESNSVSSASMFFYMRKWFVRNGAEHPWGNFYGGLQVAVNRYDTYNDTFDFPAHLELGIAPGLYREKYNVSFPLRMGIGTTFTQRSVYIYAGPAMQMSFCLTSKWIFQTQFNFTMGLGASENVLYLPIPSLITLGIQYKF